MQIDFPRVVDIKIEKITNFQCFDRCLKCVRRTERYLDSLSYSIIGCNLIDVKLLQQLMDECGVDYALPTLIIAECVLTYIKPIQ